MPSIKIFIFVISGLFLISCGSSKKSSSYSDRTTKIESSKPNGRTANKIVQYALNYEGSPYRFGGTTKRGLDCSGLVYISFLEEGISLPRTSRAMSLEGKRLKLKEVTPGDLLFFHTNKNRKVVNHVGLVVDVSDSEIRFIHSTTSRGVIISVLNQPYWKNAFMMARRVL